MEPENLNQPMAREHLLLGHPVALWILDYGLFRVNANRRVIGICGFLIRTSAGEQLLVDTGFPAKYVRDAVAATAEDGLEVFGTVLHCGPENLPAAQLKLAGTSLDQIDLMIQTHTHIDHVGGLDACPQAPIVMARAERRLPKPLYWGAAQPMDWPARDYVLIETDTEIAPGLQILLVPGHTPGQLAVLLRLPETGSVLLTSDAISRPEEMAGGFAGAWDASLAHANGERLMTLATQQDAVVIYGHCPTQWPVLKKSPLRFS
ncbi:N-acyl homoserine lactonase family protein [Sedimentitalea todarodis]|uniref:N-acyl homoserine lactonase family protein n=1 Tax=Sedimentitalea todarodis TaxID=1631240 RepID=A0ABU3VC50_9RHOB|nr:N-acyl homoserine lactonase family protein [Sedimentitalea todarodis]MDU9003314.1 N-acyl homoserine lactonase family protein [Sedimentitalea todarodis]